VTKIFEHCTIKILDIIDGDLLRDSIMTDDVFPEIFLDGGGGYVSYGLHFDPFGEVLYYDNGEGAQDGAISCEGCSGALERCENFWQASQVDTNFAASSIIVVQ
jgi:hypothetical protein